MEPKMNGFKTLSACAVLALVLAMVAPAASLAEPHRGKAGSGGAVHARSGFHGGKAYHGGGARGFGGAAPAARFSGDDAGYRGTFISGSVVGAMGFYDNGYYEDGPAAVVQDPGSDAIGYCMQTYKSYQRQSGTYLGHDGQRHACP
jgi:BA14K-like protein